MLLCIGHAFLIGGLPGLQYADLPPDKVLARHVLERLPIDALTLMYDLTSAEARVFELVYKGLTRAEIAAALRIAASTVKTHMLHLFEKTGSRRQADIIRLGARFSLPA